MQHVHILTHAELFLPAKPLNHKTSRPPGQHGPTSG